MTLTVESIPTQYHQGGPNGEVTRVVIHGTVSPCVAGGARANARYFQSPSAGGAAHYVVDPAAIVSCVDEAISAAHAPPNHGSIGVELTDPQTGDGARWQDADHQSMLALAAELVADICARHSLPLVWLSPADLLAGKKGITSHANVSQAWHQTDHTDPGPDFPVDQFLALCSPQLPKDEDMTPAVAFDKTGRRWELVVDDNQACSAYIDDVLDPTPLGGSWTSGLTAFNFGDRIAVSGRGSDGALWHMTFDPADAHNTVAFKSLGGHLYPKAG